MFCLALQPTFTTDFFSERENGKKPPKAALQNKMVSLTHVLTMWVASVLIFRQKMCFVTGVLLFTMTVISAVCSLIFFLLATRDPRLSWLCRYVCQPTQDLPLGVTVWAPDLVISRYTEHLDWVPRLMNAQFQPKITVYTKHPVDGLAPDIERLVSASLRLPNVGREAHTFLSHVVTNYDNLAPMTIFAMGSVDVVGRWLRFGQLLRTRFGTFKDGIVGTACCSARGLQQKLKLNSYEGKPLVPAKHRPWGKWLDATFGPESDHKILSFNSTFCASRQSIRARPKAFYESLVRELEEGGNDSELGFFLERAWPLVFSFSDDALIQSAACQVFVVASAVPGIFLENWTAKYSRARLTKKKN